MPDKDTTSTIWLAEPGRPPIEIYITWHDFVCMGCKEDYPWMPIDLAKRLIIRHNCMLRSASGHAFCLTKEEACAIVENSRTPPMFTEDI